MFTIKNRWYRIDDGVYVRKFILKDESLGLTLIKSKIDDENYYVKSTIDVLNNNFDSIFNRLTSDMYVIASYFDNDNNLMEFVLNLFENALFAFNAWEYFSLEREISTLNAKRYKIGCPICGKKMSVEIIDDENKTLIGRCKNRKCRYVVDLEQNSIFKHLYTKIKLEDIEEVELDDLIDDYKKEETYKNKNDEKIILC